MILNAIPIQCPDIYILLSIKTRIETRQCFIKLQWIIQFISYYPLKQGLKLSTFTIDDAKRADLYPTIH